uniref:Capsid protein n=1 Tax=Cressdnaviricota sp. TaxID=2748378 RepID=A0A4D6IWM8_9VIRU|nr:capsid protein [Cressdnaviricota sp.]QCC72740.1 capsid protein [Cressdnaviricota sp.]
MATNFVTAKYQEIYDLGTQAGKTTILGIHTPDDGNVYNMLSGFFDQFRKYKYKGCNVSMVPAAQLPADPLQVSFEAGELTCDPRDLLNPILFHGCHGEELNEILDNLYYKGSNPMGSVHEGVTDTALAESSYYAALSDPSFRKYGIQSGAKVSLKPMVHPVALTNPMVPSDSAWSYAYDYQKPDGQTVVRTGSYNGNDVGEIQDDGDIQYPSMFLPLKLTGTGFPVVTAPLTQQNNMFTNGLRPLGWLPTWQFVPAVDTATTEQTNNISRFDIRTSRLPRLYMGFFILPPSYTQEMYFRLIITHYFEFKDFSTALTRHSIPTGNPDRYVYHETIPEPTVSGQATSLSVVDGSISQTSEGVY